MKVFDTGGQICQEHVCDLLENKKEGKKITTREKPEPYDNENSSMKTQRRKDQQLKNRQRNGTRAQKKVKRRSHRIRNTRIVLLLSFSSSPCLSVLSMSPEGKDRRE